MHGQAWHSPRPWIKLHKPRGIRFGCPHLSEVRIL